MSSEPEIADAAVPEFGTPEVENLFLASSGGLHTFGDLFTFERAFLQLLFDYDHTPDQTVGFLGDSSDEVIFGIAACWRLGIPFVCFNSNATGEELQRQIAAVNPGVVLVDDAYQKLLPSTQTIPMKQIALDRILSVQVTLSTRAEQFRPNLEPDRVFGYFFTSGTSGKPKIVPLRRRQMLFATESSARNFKLRINHFWLLCLPLNHIGGISIIIRSLLYGTGIYRMRRFDTSMVSTFLSENPLFQAASLVPTMLKRLLEIPAFQTHKNFRAILLGGGPIDPDLLRLATEKGIPMVPSYGMTETCAQIAANPLLAPSGLYPPMRSVGRVFEPNEIQIRDRDGSVAGANESGTIWLRGPQVFDGYLHEESSEYFDSEGWFNTGDFGYLNNNGQLLIQTRRSDLIISGGENISPVEVEQTLVKIDTIREAAVVGIPDDEWGQLVAAAVVTETSDDLDDEAIRDQLREHLSAYKIPKLFLKVDSLPHTSSGKIIRREVIRLFK